MEERETTEDDGALTAGVLNLLVTSVAHTLGPSFAEKPEKQGSKVKSFI